MKPKGNYSRGQERKFVPHVYIFGGKAFATYVQEKMIVKRITDVGVTINHETEIGDLLKVSSICFYDMSA